MLPGPRATRSAQAREQQVEGSSALLGSQSSRDCSPPHLPQHGLKGLLVRRELRPSLAQDQPMQGPACRNRPQALTDWSALGRLPKSYSNLDGVNLRLSEKFKSN